MESICLIYPWFGKLNSYFELWLDSAKKNSTIDFLIYTSKDNVELINSFSLTPNIKLFESSLESISKQMSKIYGGAILLDRSYKLCDYKPFYCYIFEETKKYDFWGFGDMDVILGNLRKFFTAQILNNYDVIGNVGHMQIVRNNDAINRLVFDVPKDFLDKVVFDTKTNYFFDEGQYSRFNLLKSKRKLLIWDDVADTRKPSRKFGLKYFRFTFPCDDETKHRKQCIYYNRNDGSLFLVKIINKKIIKKEVIYAHFQKRFLKNCVKNKNVNFWLCFTSLLMDILREDPIMPFPVSFPDVKRHSLR